MRVSSDVGAVQQAGIPLRRIVNEGDYLTWQRALEDPARASSTVVAFDGDVVSQAVQRHPEGLQLSNVICSTGQPAPASTIPNSAKIAQKTTHGFSAADADSQPMSITLTDVPDINFRRAGK
jgi:hypothetical protein